MIDCSHGNSGKDPANQVKSGNDVAAQIAAGEERIFGVMVESHLKEGRQDLLPGKPLVYGQSITDACVGLGRNARLDRCTGRRRPATALEGGSQRRLRLTLSRQLNPAIFFSISSGALSTC